VINHDIGRAISGREVLEMTAIADSLREDVEHGIRWNHAALLLDGANSEVTAAQALCRNPPISNHLAVLILGANPPSAWYI